MGGIQVLKKKAAWTPPELLLRRYRVHPLVAFHGLRGRNKITFDRASWLFFAVSLWLYVIPLIL